tara:strand:- start:159 stop:332 length:174 start_codon:yes stop_codon:yes gene_type:complete
MFIIPVDHATSSTPANPLLGISLVMIQHLSQEGDADAGLDQMDATEHAEHFQCDGTG